MAHKTVETAIADVEKQQKDGFGLILVWRKDFERWETELRNACGEKFTQLSPPLKRTKNQYFIAEKKPETA